MPLVTYANFVAYDAAIQGHVSNGTMPPAGNPTLSQAQKSTLLNYIEAGTMPAGNVICP